MANVFYFGDSGRRLFGLYEVPAEPKRHGVVLCPPLGTEYFYAHQSVRLLGQLLAEAGQHVLRFDWYGSGDSAGEPGDGDSDASRAEDLSWAIDELRDLAGIRKVSLVGLRGAATAVLAAAAERNEIKRAVLWDPLEPATADKNTCVVCHADDAGRHTDAIAYQGPRPWLGDGDFGAEGMPVQALRAITEWLA